MATSNSTEATTLPPTMTPLSSLSEVRSNCPLVEKTAARVVLVVVVVMMVVAVVVDQSTQASLERVKRRPDLGKTAALFISS